MKATKQDRFKCQLCEKDLSSKKELARHVKIIHKHEKIKCSKCEENFDSRSSMAWHHTKVHFGKRFHCDTVIRVS